jgi:sulfur carrier protein
MEKDIAMLTVEVNGEKRQIQELSTVADLLVDIGIVGRRVTVERNREEVPTNSYDNTVVENGDVYEIFEHIGS